MIRWVNSSLLGASYEDMVVFECVTMANERCRCLEGCYGEVLRDCVFHQGYDGLCYACMRVCVCAIAGVRVRRRLDGWSRMG